MSGPGIGNTYVETATWTTTGTNSPEYNTYGQTIFALLIDDTGHITDGDVWDVQGALSTGSTFFDLYTSTAGQVQLTVGTGRMVGIQQNFGVAIAACPVVRFQSTAASTADFSLTFIGK